MNRLRTIALAAIFIASAARLEAQDPAPFPNDLVAWDTGHATAVFRGTGEDTWDRKIRERGWIAFEDGAYHLWYTGYNDDRSPLRLLGHATSPDGQTWTRDPANPLVKDKWVEDVCVIKQGPTYWMFAEGERDVAHLLASTDRIRWEDRGPLDIRKVDGTPISPGPRGTPTPWFEDGVWSLFYERGDRGVWLARSKDMKVWTNVDDEPVLAMGPAAYDRTAVAFDQIIKREGVYYAYYHANAHQPWKDWTSNLARSRDLIRWEKYPGNPIAMDNASSPILVAGPSGPRLFTMHPEVRVHRPSASK